MMHSPLQDRRPPPDAYTRGVAPAPSAGALRERRKVGVAVIGGGFTGLSAALHLAEAGADVAVLEARDIGWGASGRAFGQVVPYLKRGHAEIIARYGAERGVRVIDAVAAGPDLVFSLVERHRIACDAVRTGLIFAAHAPAGRRGLERRTSYWQGRGAPVRMLDARGTEAAIGTTAYEACSLDERGGHLNPFAYAVGLARAASAAGAAIHPGSPVRVIASEGKGWRLEAGQGELLADAVIIATNAYSGALWPGLRESFVAMRGHAIVTKPLSENVRRAILPGRQSMTDTRRLFSGIRVLADGRLHISGDGPAFGPEKDIFRRNVTARVAGLFPFLGEPEWRESWSGWVAMTRDWFPRVHELAPGVFAGYGYNGRGIAAATLVGRDLARLAGGGAPADTLTFPLSPLRPIPAHALAPILAGGLLGWYRLGDAMRGFGGSMRRNGGING